MRLEAFHKHCFNISSNNVARYITILVPMWEVRRQLKKDHGLPKATSELRLSMFKNCGKN